MARYLVVRLVSSVLLFFAITLFVFVAFFVLPANNSRRTASLGDTYRIHGSMPGEYAHYVWNMVGHGDLGDSYADREAVTARLFRAAPVTLSLVLGGLFVWLLIAIPLGILCALRPRSRLDRTATALVLIGISVQPVWLGLILGYVFGERWPILPSGGYCDLFSPVTECGGPAQWTSHLVLPWLTFGLLNAALYTTMIRAVLVEELSHDYVRAARAKGAGEARVLRAHVLKNVLLPFATMIAMNMGIALGGIIFIESAFSLPGLGGMLRRSIVQRDLPQTAGIVVFITVAIVLLNLVVDLVSAALDPRIRGARASPRRARLPGLTCRARRPSQRSLRRNRLRSGFRYGDTPASG
jgi:peptide/nickel transport system permease protein